MLSPYPRLLTIHGNLRLIKKQVGFKPFSAIWFQSILEGIVVPRFDGIICITNYTQEAVALEVKRTWVVPNAVDLSFLELGEKRMRRRDEVNNDKNNNSGFKSQVSGLDFPPIILVVANVDERKNQNVFIRALDPLAKKMNFEVRFFGNCGGCLWAGISFSSQGALMEQLWWHDRQGGVEKRVFQRDDPGPTYAGR